MPPPRRKDVDGKPKQYVGIGRIGTQAQSEDMKPKFKPKGQFNVSEGRDYTLDAPVKQDEEDETPQLTNKKTKKPFSTSFSYRDCVLDCPFCSKLKY